MRTPAVSVVMVNYNRERFVGAAIRSVLEQTAVDWELIVVENGSTDGSLSRIERLARTDQRIRVVKLADRVAIPAAANVGIQEAGGEYIARLDSDDVWFPRHLEEQLDWLEQSENARIGVCGAQCELIDCDGNVIGAKWFPVQHSDCVRAFWYRNPFCQSAVMIRAECFRWYGLYDETFEVAEDLELWARLAQGFELYNRPVVLVRQRLWADSACMARYKVMVDATLRARRLAMVQYGHSASAAARMTLGLTWLGRWCPPRCARWLFHKMLSKTHRRTELNSEEEGAIPLDGHTSVVRTKTAARE